MAELPRTHDELKEAIAARYAALPPQLQRIARFALERPGEIALGTVAALAEAAGVPPSSFVRFAHALGFSGFSPMQRLFQRRLVERASPAASPPAAHAAFVAEAMGELARLEERCVAADVEAAARLLASARAIAVLAQRRGFPVGCYVAHALLELRWPARLLDGLGGMLGAAAGGVGRGDVLVVAAFGEDAPEMVDTARACRGRGARVIVIADSALTPLRPLADVCLETGGDGAGPPHSLVAAMCLARSLVASAVKPRASAPPAVMAPAQGRKGRTAR